MTPRRLSPVFALLALACAGQPKTGGPTTGGDALPPLPTTAPTAFEGIPVEVTAEEARYTFDGKGRKTFTYRLTYRVRSVAALEKWGTISADWTPWYQDRPLLKATVTTAGGRTFELDPKSLAEQPVGSRDRLLYSDRRRLVAPLPGLEVGALVEQTTIVKDRIPFFAEGVLGRFYFGLAVPVFNSRLILDAPEDTPLAFEVRGKELVADDTTEGGRRVVTFETGLLLPQGAFEPLLPPEAPRYPYVAFSTARSWQDVAARYGALVERQILGANVTELVEGIDVEAMPRDEVIRLLVQRLHKRVRYTGIEFGKQAIVPWRPAETLGRGYGDCKDKSALLVAMLRAKGIEANVAILKAGYGEDVRPALPGLEAFNHAIVHVPGERPLWIDATANLTPVGEIPTSVQGRRALVASFDSTELVEVPEHPVSHARYLEERTIKMSEWGTATIVERTTATGAMQDKLRVQYSSAPREGIRSALNKYVTSTYKAVGLTRFAMSEPMDVATPFELEVEAIGARVASTDARKASVQLRTAVLFSWIPEELRLAALAEVDEADRDRQVAAEAILGRKNDLEIFEPYVAQIRYVVKVPKGFEVREVPQDRRYAMGPAYFDAKYEVGAEEIVATFTVDLAKRRYSADEARAFVTGLYTVFDSPIERLELVHRGARLLADGDNKAALEAYRGLIVAEPDVAYHHARLADAYLSLGLGAPAREAAEEAQRLGSGSAEVMYAVARVFAHDLFGRPYAPGFDKARATAAYQRVLDLQPDRHEARFALAVTMEHSADGVRYGDIEGTKEAVELYRRLPRGDGHPNHDNNLLIALNEAQDYEGLLEAASIAERSKLRDTLLVAATAMTDGTRAAFEALDGLGLDPDTRQAIASEVATSLSHKRHYEEARAMLERFARNAKDPIAMQQRIATLARLRRHDLPDGPPRTPVDVVQRVLSAMFHPTVDRERLKTLFADLQDDGALESEVERLTAGSAAFTKAARTSGLPAPMMRDHVLAMTKFFVEGDDRTGYRVSGRVVGSGGQRTTWWFVVKEKGAYRLRASEASLSSVGEEALHLFRRKKTRAARQWLNWAKEVVPYRGGADVLERHPFLALWSAGRGPLAASAAALAATGPRGHKVVDELEKARRRHNAPEVRRHIDHAILIALAETDRHQERLEVAQRLYRQLPTSALAFDYYCRALLQAGQGKKAKKLLAQRVDEEPRDAVARARLSDTLLELGETKAADALMRETIRLGVATPSTYNNLAWLQLFTGAIDADDVELAVEANTMTQFETPSFLHTLAALYAEVGKTTEAYSLVLRRMDLNGQTTPESADWYLIGLVMESYGLTRWAKEAYERVEDDEARSLDSTFALAQKKLDRLRRVGAGKRI
ncbi:MAG: DUF3857 domain-containing protein [Deltaproteobacteria bacterium]|jgi:tetratricopeptide (TPR) repeat protein/transglutaminase-like putative cysteine protease